MFSELTSDIQRIGFIGAGKMAQAMITGFIKQGFPKEQIVASTATFESKQNIAETYGIAATTSNKDVVALADVVFICVKPALVEQVCREIVSGDSHQNLVNKTVVSIAAGVPRVMINDWLLNIPCTLTAMPNLPVSVAEGAIALYGSQYAEVALLQAESLLSQLGKVYKVGSEVELAYMVGLAGSAPAYYYAMVEAIETAAKNYHLDHANVKDVIRQTTIGTLKLLQDHNFDASALKAQVTSPNGTTQQALDVLDHHHMPESIHEAMEAAVLKTMEQLSFHLTQSQKGNSGDSPIAS